jgi:hypothetical protein
MSTADRARRLIGRRSECPTSDELVTGIAKDRSGSIERIRVAQQRAQPGAAVVS